MITKPQRDKLFWEVYWQWTTKLCMHYQADIVFLNKRLIMPGHTGLLSAHSYKQTTSTDFRQLHVTRRRNSKFLVWGVPYLLLMFSVPSTFQNSLLQCIHFFDLGCSLMHLKEGGYGVKGFGFWTVNWCSHRRDSTACPFGTGFPLPTYFPCNGDTSFWGTTALCPPLLTDALTHRMASVSLLTFRPAL